MINLAGNDRCDERIKIELEKANADITSLPQHVYSEVPYSIISKIGDWTLTRAWYYWMASCEGDGLPLDIAAKMHEKKYPDEMFDDENPVRIYGNAIRVVGHCGCPHPSEWTNIKGCINSYHIDTQEGLNELVRTLKKHINI